MPDTLLRPVNPDEPIPGYRLTELLGRGGYGEVWKTSAPGGVSKAVKLISEDNPSHGTMELRAINRIKDIRHPFLLSIDRIEQLPGRLAIVMELGDRNLQQYCQTFRDKGLPGIPQDELVRMLRDVADVLDFIYQEYALQHLDVKAANLLLFGKRLKVADFGLVKNIYEQASIVAQAMTPAYAAPEIFGGKPSGTSDQYSLAIVYQEMLTGTLPFEDPSPSGLAMKHLNDTPNLASLPPEQRPIIARALSKNPQLRFPTCTALIEELSAAVHRAGQRSALDQAVFPLPKDLLFQPRPEAAAKPLAQPKTDELKLSAELAAPQSPETVCPPPDVPHVPPTLVIGIGGTAAKLLQQLRERMCDRLGDQADHAGFKLLLIDTDSEALCEPQRDRNRPRGIEFVTTPLLSADEYRTQGQRHRRWLSRRWLFNIPRSLRTDGLRPLGRLALMSHGARVQHALRSALQEVLAAPPEVVAGRYVAGPPRVLLIASISGGTGSGMLLDLAYAARAELQRLDSPRSTVEGLLLQSTPAGVERDKAIINAVAALQELAHYSRGGHCYPGEPLLDVPPFHGNNRTFERARLMSLGQNLEGPRWLRAVDDAAEYVFTQLTTPPAEFAPPTGDAAADDLLCVSQARQIGGNGGQFLRELTHQLCQEIVRGWSGAAPQGSGAAPTTLPATMRMQQTILQSEHTARQQKFSDHAAEKVHELGVDLQQLIARAREVLRQELATSERGYLRAMIQETVSVAGESKPADHEFALRLLSLQDRAIGLDFGERGGDASQNTLFDLLSCRLASQAMNLAVKFTNWVNELMDDPAAGVEAARLAAEAGRNYLHDLAGSLGKEIQAVHKEQTESRIKLIAQTVAGKQPKGSHWWSFGRAPGDDELEQNLIGHGLLCLEELVLACVQKQVRTVEAQATAVIDKLWCFGQELSEFALRFRELAAPAADEDEESQHAGDRGLQQLLRTHRTRLVEELRRKINQEVLEGPKKLQRFLARSGMLSEQLHAPLVQLARRVVLSAMRQVLILLAQNGTPAGSDLGIDLDGLLAGFLTEPLPWEGGAAPRAIIAVPDLAAAEPVEQRLAAAGLPARVIQSPGNNIAVCRDAPAPDVFEIVQSIALHQPALVRLAENVHSRTDVAWEPLLPAVPKAVEEPAAVAGTDFAHTVCLDGAPPAP